MPDYHQLNELSHLIRTASYLSGDTRMYFNLLYSPLPSHKVSVLLNQKFSFSEGNHRSSTSSEAQDRIGSSGNFGFSPVLSPSSSKRRRPLSPEVSDHDSYNVPFPPHPVPSTWSSAPARKKKKKISQPSVDVAAVMQTLLQALQQQPQQPQHSFSELSDEELFDEVIRKLSYPPPIPRESPLAEEFRKLNSPH